MKRFIAALVAGLLACTGAYAQSGTVTNHAFAIGKGPNITGYTSLLCGSAQLAVGQAAANPICQTLSGDGTLSAAGVLAVTKTNGVAFSVLATTVPGIGVATFLTTPSGTNLAAALTSPLPISKGGTAGTTQQTALNGVMPTGVNPGDLVFWNGTNWVDFNGNTAGTKVLQETAAGVPSWVPLSGGAVNIAARAGSFDVWQRGAGSSASIAVLASTVPYTADGWYIATNANQAMTVAAVAGIATGSFKAAKVTRNSGQTGVGLLRFAMPLDIDEAALIAGNFVTLSFTIKEGANQSFSHTVNYAVFCGTTATAAKRGATPYTGDSATISTSVTTTTTATRFSATSASAAIAGCAQAEIQFNWTPSGTAGADDSFTVDDVQLEVVASSSSVASSYVYADINAQLAKCIRHFDKSFAYGTAPANNIVGDEYAGFAFTTAGLNSQRIPFHSRMRVSPTMAFFSSNNKASPTAGQWQWFNGSAWADVTSMSIANSGADINDNSFVAALIVTTTAQQAFIIGGGWTADAGI